MADNLGVQSMHMRIPHYCGFALISRRARPQVFRMRWLLVGFLVVGCGASSRAIVGPDGQRWWSITCRRNQDNCYDEAAERCPRGYDVGDLSGGVSYVPNTYNGAMYPVYGGRMLVKCR